MKWKGVAPTLNHVIQPFSRTLLFEEIKILKGNQCGANPPSLPPLAHAPIFQPGGIMRIRAEPPGLITRSGNLGIQLGLKEVYNWH